MKKWMALAAFALILAPVAAQAQERQVYPHYPAPALVEPSYGTGEVQQAPQNYRTYPGRENYNDRFGYIPRHPGDYRDAVDRGSWRGGGGARQPRQYYSYE